MDVSASHDSSPMSRMSRESSRRKSSPDLARRDDHVGTRSAEAIDAKVLLSVLAPKDSKCVLDLMLLSPYVAHQTRHEIRLASGVAEGLVAQQRTLVDEADDLGQGSDVVR